MEYHLVIDLVFLYCDVRSKTAISISNKYNHMTKFKDYKKYLKQFLLKNKIFSRWKLLKKVNNRRVWVKRCLHSEDDPILLY